MKLRKLPSLPLIIIFFLLASCQELPEQMGMIRAHRGDSLNREHPEGWGEDYPAAEEEPPVFEPPQDSSASPVDTLTETVVPDVYVCGVENADTDNGRLVIFKNGSRINEISPSAFSPFPLPLDPDSHFLIGSNLYSVQSDNSSTGVWKDDKLLFLYPSREYVTQLMLIDNDIWTMGRNRSGEGFALRKNGETVFSKAGGTEGLLYRDQGHLHFSYSLEIGQAKLIYLVTDGADFQLTAQMGGKLLDAAVSEGTLWYLEATDTSYIVSSSHVMYEYERAYGFEFRSASLIPMQGGGCAAVVELYAPGIGMPAEIICIGEKRQLQGGGGGSYHYYSQSPPVDISYTRYRDQLVIKSPGGEGEERIDDVDFAGERCAMQHENQLYLCCAPRDGSRPIVWKRGGMRMELKLNGVPTGIWVQAD